MREGGLEQDGSTAGGGENGQVQAWYKASTKSIATKERFPSGADCSILFIYLFIFLTPIFFLCPWCAVA